MSEQLYIGLISGTSRDGVDAALVQFENDKPQLLHALCLPIPEPLKSDLEALVLAGRAPAYAEYGSVDEFLGRHFSRAARTLCEQAGIEMRDVDAVGSHGQTVWHQPDGENPYSLQLGNPRVIARATRVTTIADFRSADLAAGGQGAPLAPLLHRQLFSSGTEARAILNLVGIANLTFLPIDDDITGFDCGPANCLMDLWSRRHLGQPYDERGKWAGGGTTDPVLLDALLGDPYFHRAPPKSTGLEYFNAAWLEGYLANHATDPRDIQSTLADLVARTVADSIEGQDIAIQRLLVCGGGVHNLHLIRRLAAVLPGVIVESTAHHGVNPDWIEAILFAWLARERLHERTLDTRGITGASNPVLLGDIFFPPEV